MLLLIYITNIFTNHITSNVIFFNKRSSIKKYKKLPKVENQLSVKNIENKYKYVSLKKKRVFKLSHFTNSLALFFTRTMLINL